MMSTADSEFAAILAATESRLRSYIAGLGAAPDMVDDVAQDVYVAFYQDMARRPADVEPIRWLKGIARNLCMNQFRRAARQRRRHLAALAELLDGGWSRQPDEGPQDDRREILGRCLERLPERQRRLVALRYAEEASAEGIARTLAISVGAVRVTLLRIRRGLRDCIGQRLAWRASK